MNENSQPYLNNKKLLIQFNSQSFKTTFIAEDRKYNIWPKYKYVQ